MVCAMDGGSIWERFTLDPRVEQNAHMRASDRDRDVVNEVLGTAYAEGRLTAEELDERTDHVARARTLGELPALVSDLVASTPVRVPRADLHAEAVRRYRMQRQQALLGWLVPTLICWVIWAVTTQGFPWPAIVTVATGVRLLQLLITREETIESIERRLERKERKRLGSRQRRELPQPPPPDRRDQNNSH
jgi:hypothetical protein